MVYDFKNRKSKSWRVVFALTLDKKRMTERIVIGKDDEVHRRFENNDGDVFYDKVRPIGSLLFHFEQDKSGEWSNYKNILCESYTKVVPTEIGRWKLATPVSISLQDKYNSGEPSAVFAAVRVWEEYLACFKIDHGADVFNKRMTALYNPFVIYNDDLPWEKEIDNIMSKAIRNEESSVELWYPIVKRPFETVVTGLSLLPLIAYYQNKIREWKLVYQTCKVCGNVFTARSRHYELCSKSCKKVMAVSAKREHDERIQGNEAEEAYIADYNYWFNRLRRLRKGNNTEAIASFEAAFKAHRKEALRRKATVKNDKELLKDFNNWLYSQQIEVNRLIEILITKNNNA